MDDLAVEWLNALLFHHATDVFLPGDNNITVDKTHHSPSAFIQGERFDRDRHYLRTEVDGDLPESQISILRRVESPCIARLLSDSGPRKHRRDLLGFLDHQSGACRSSVGVKPRG